MSAKWNEIDAYVEAFERARSDGPVAELSAFAPPPGHELHAAVLRELIRVDLEFGWSEGRPITLREYQSTFPALFADSATTREIAFEEYRLRRQSGQRPDLADYRMAGIDVHDWPALHSQEFSTPRVSPSGQSGSLLESGYRRSRLTHGAAATGLSDQSPHIALFRAVYLKDPFAADRLAQAVQSWPEVGDQFCGFRLMAELGRGVFGRVFLAQQGDLANRPVALKVVCDTRGEPQRLARLQHTNIVPVYSVHAASPFQAICMPYFGGTTLADILKALTEASGIPSSGAELAAILRGRSRHESLPESPSPDALARFSYTDAVLRIAERLADGLAHAHERGMLHRDIKPANVLLAADGQPMLLDFNLAADLAPLGIEGAQLGGTLPYMPPELLETLRSGTRPVMDARGDVYALGLVIWELLAARHPFSMQSGTVPEALAPMIAERQSPPDIRTINSSVTPAFRAIIARCLAPAPDRRYATARELQEDLRRQLDDRPLQHTREPSIRERLAKFRRRHPKATIVALALSVLVPLAALAAIRSRELVHAQAGRSFDAFRTEKRFAWMILNLLDIPSTDRAKGLEVAGRAMARFDGPAGRTHFEQLTASEQQEVRRDLGGLALVSAEAIRRSGQTDALDDARRLYHSAHNYLRGGPGERLILLQWADFEDRAGRPADAKDLRKRAERLPATSGLDTYPEIKKAFADGRYRAAIKLTRQSLDQDPSNPLLWHWLADFHLRLDELEAALGCLDACRALYPGFHRTHYQRGVVQLRRHDPAAARAEFDSTLRLQPDYWPALLQRAVARADLKDIKGAAADLDQAAQYPNTPAQIEFIRARVLARAGDAAGAARAKAAGFQRQPIDADDWVVRGLARIDDDPAGALNDFSAALKLDPRHCAALRNQANVLAESLGKLAEAVTVLNSLIAINPDSATDLGGRGVVLARLGRRDDALRDAVAALRADSRPFTRYQVAGIYALTSRTNAADAVEAIRLLASAFRDSVGLDLVDRDSDLDALRQRPEFRRVVEAARVLHETGGPRLTDR